MRTYLRNSTLKPSSKRIPARSNSELAKLEAKADRLAAELCRKRGVCEHCGKTTNLTWAHIVRRGYSGLRWAEDNCVALCAYDHAIFTANPKFWEDWLLRNMPIRYLDLKRRSREIHKPNRWEMDRIIKDLQARLAQV